MLLFNLDGSFHLLKHQLTHQLEILDMLHHMKRLILSGCAFVLLCHSHLIYADTGSDTEKILNWAENTYPEIFSGHQATQNIEPWLYRHYPETGIYAGVNKNDNGVYLLGGIWGDQPTYIDTLANLIAHIDSLGGNGSVAACDTSKTPAGITYSQSGNVVTVTSSGQCVAAPDLANTNLCSVPRQTTASGISLLGSNTVTSSRLEGLTINIPGLPDPIKGIDASANVKHCTINVAADTANLIVNSDLCFDITTTVTNLLAGFPVDGIALTPPVKYYTAGTYTSNIVDDCFATDATTVSDAFTGEMWVRQNGEYVKIDG